MSSMTGLSKMSCGSGAGGRRYFRLNGVVGASVEVSGPGETGAGFKEMIGGLGGTGLERRSVEPGNSGGGEVAQWPMITAATGWY